nr:MAG TPA: hypothetical protein [Caudoviricetes sp.]
MRCACMRGQARENTSVNYKHLTPSHYNRCLRCEAYGRHAGT